MIKRFVATAVAVCIIGSGFLFADNTKKETVKAPQAQEMKLNKEHVKTHKKVKVKNVDATKTEKVKTEPKVEVKEIKPILTPRKK